VIVQLCMEIFVRGTVGSLAVSDDDTRNFIGAISSMVISYCLIDCSSFHYLCACC